MTWYIFDSQGENIGYCDHEPNHEDLAERREVAVYHAGVVTGALKLVNGEVVDIGVPPSAMHVWQDGEWLADKAAEKSHLTQIKSAKLREINRAAEVFINQVSGGLPEFEVETWDAQAAEAKAWHAEKSTPTPIIDQIAQARGVDAAALRAKAYKKLTDFERLTGCYSVNEFRLRLIGRRQALEAAVNAAATAEDVAAIQARFGLEANNE